MVELPTETEPVSVIEGDALSVLPSLPAGCVDAVVTDPPYGLSFMGREWDHGVPGVEFWTAAGRVLKPGGYMLAMGGTRTYHRLACAVEDAGFEIRDCLMWVYGSGFPKAKSCLKPAYEPILLCRKPGGRVLPLGVDECRVGTTKDTPASLPKGDALKGWGDRPGRKGKQLTDSAFNGNIGRWPANVLHDGSDEVLGAFAALGERKPGSPVRNRGFDLWREMEGRDDRPAGADHDGYSDTGTAARFFYCAKASRAERNAGLEGMPLHELRHYADDACPHRNGKASGGELTNGTGYVSPQSNSHPTVKPLALMRWLVRLVTSPGGLILDPFAGSGTTGVAAALEGRRCILVEKEPAYAAIARKRIAEATGSGLLAGVG